MAYRITILRPPGSPHVLSREIVVAQLEAYDCVAGAEGDGTYYFHEGEEEALFEARLVLRGAECPILGDSPDLRDDEESAHIRIVVPDARLADAAETALTVAFDLAARLGWLVLDEQRGQFIEPEEVDAIVASLGATGLWSHDDGDPWEDDGLDCEPF